MIPFFQALNIVIQNAIKLNTERIHFTDAPGRVLAENISSDIDMPPFHKSAVDGFACRKEDLGIAMKILETIPAGKTPGFRITAGTSSRIMTGAMVPEGADCVFMVEDSCVEGDFVKFKGEEGNNNICNKGEDIRKGDVLIKAGTRMGSQHIACLAAVGVISPLVYTKPRVGIISTGDELVEPEKQPENAQIRNSNAYQLIAQVRNAGGEAEYLGIAKDSEKELQQMINLALKSNDVVILTGGVSMGDFDYVPAVLKDLGFAILVQSVAIQPGKPTVFARKDKKYVFGLPGNPVSSFVLFEMLVKPFLNLMSDDISVPGMFSMTAGKEFKRKKADRMAVIPVQIIDGKAFPVEYHGSAHINAYTVANGMGIFEVGKKTIPEGDTIDVRQL